MWIHRSRKEPEETLDKFPQQGTLNNAELNTEDDKLIQELAEFARILETILEKSK